VSLLDKSSHPTIAAEQWAQYFIWYEVIWTYQSSIHIDRTILLLWYRQHVKAASHTVEIVTWLAHGSQNVYSFNVSDVRG
jgi:hypothetical protein